MKLVVLVVVLFAACVAQTQNLKFSSVSFAPDGLTPATIHFFCSQDYDKAECLKDVAALRATVLDHSLFSASVDRRVELMKWSGLPSAPALVDLAITHEMGHAICREKNERKADDYGRELREGKVPDCSRTAGDKVSSQTQSVVAATTNGNQLGSDVINSQTATVKGLDNGDGVSAESNRGVSDLYAHPEVQAALRQIWSRAGGGLLTTEGAFTYDKNAGVKLVPPTNEYETMTFEIQPTTQAIFHTHPAGQNRMSQNDINTANQNHVDMYVLSRDGLYFYRPGMKAPQLVMTGTDFLGKKGGAK